MHHTASVIDQILVGETITPTSNSFLGYFKKYCCSAVHGIQLLKEFSRFKNISVPLQISWKNKNILPLFRTATLSASFCVYVNE